VATQSFALYGKPTRSTFAIGLTATTPFTPEKLGDSWDFFPLLLAMQEPLLNLAPRLGCMQHSLAFLHKINWDPHNETEGLIPQAKKYKQEHDCRPEQIYVDQI
jgi:hypothetical protein